MFYLFSFQPRNIAIRVALAGAGDATAPADLCDDQSVPHYVETKETCPFLMLLTLAPWNTSDIGKPVAR